MTHVPSPPETPEQAAELRETLLAETLRTFDARVEEGNALALAIARDRLGAAFDYAQYIDAMSPEFVKQAQARDEFKQYASRKLDALMAAWAGRNQ